MKPGDYVKFIGCSKDQVNWGNCDDPNDVLFLGDQYYVEHVHVHSMHTKIELRGVKGKFNSVCFDVLPKREAKRNF